VAGAALKIEQPLSVEAVTIARKTALISGNLFVLFWIFFIISTG
jgi:hypothetical protein